MSMLVDPEPGKLSAATAPEQPQPASKEMTSSAFHRVQQTSAPHISNDSKLSVNNKLGSSTVTSPEMRTEEDEVDSPTPSSTASESRSPTTVTITSDQQHFSGDSHRRHQSSDGKGDDIGDDQSVGRKDAFAWPSHSAYDEQLQLLGTEEESSDARASSEEDFLLDEDDENGSHHPTTPGKRSVWAITKEQLNYYTTQFFNMQPNPNGIIPGAQAKEFFEKSRLPITELRTIWQLSDVSKDGGLSLEEFLTAMHLVVLRRNDISLPETLPGCLCPRFLKRKLQPMLGGLTLAHPDGRNLESGDARRQSSGAAETMSLVSIVSSPGNGPKPVNFDFSRSDVRRDPHIVQPVALRLSDSPVDHPGNCQSSDLDDTEDEAKRAEQMRRPSGQKQAKGEVLYEQLWTAKDDDEDSVDGSDSIQINSLGCGPSSLPPSQHIKLVGTSQHSKAHPPPPPPRAGKISHARSSSLDLNRFDHINPRHTAKLPPAVPPRCPNESPSNSTQDEEQEEHYSPSPRASTGHAAIAFHRQSRSGLGGKPTEVSELSRDAKSLRISIHEYKERNSVIARTINELHQEVSDTLEERIALEYQLEQLKSFGE